MPGATFKQRTALFNMYSATGRSVVGIRDMAMDEASRAIDEVKKEIAAKGFKKTNTTSDGLGDDPAEW